MEASFRQCPLSAMRAERRFVAIDDQRGGLLPFPRTGSVLDAAVTLYLKRLFWDNPFPVCFTSRANICGDNPQGSASKPTHTSKISRNSFQVSEHDLAEGG